MANRVATSNQNRCYKPSPVEYVMHNFPKQYLGNF